MIGLDAMSELICIGGWPVKLGRNTGQALLANGDHLDEIVSSGYGYTGEGRGGGDSGGGAGTVT